MQHFGNNENEIMIIEYNVKHYGKWKNVTSLAMAHFGTTF